jgi:hypothetical protein
MPQHFFLYVEGPRDLEILTIWARQESRELAKQLERVGVILGGRQPERAIRHLAEHVGASGVCLLDRDGGDEAVPEAVPGLHFFQWTRRHIEAYLLVPRALRAGLAPRDDPNRLDDLLRDEIPEDEAAFQELHAKQLLGNKGPFARALGRAPDLRRVARTMRSDDLHADIQTLFGILREGLGLMAPVVTYRVSSTRTP